MKLYVWTALLVLSGLWVLCLFWQDPGVFAFLGFDFSAYWSATRAFIERGPASAYDLSVLEAYRQRLTHYASLPAGESLGPAPVAYPPLFFLIMAPFTLGSPILSFLLWTSLNMGLGVLILRRLSERCGRQSWWLTALLVASPPLFHTLLQGQPLLFTLIPIYFAYLAFERNRDFTAGLWIGLLLFKPQYVIGLVLVLLYRRRWRSLAGVSLAGLAIALPSAVMLGPDGVRAYLDMIGRYSGFLPEETTAAPQIMINWHGFLTIVGHQLSEQQGQALTALLSLASYSTLLIIWRKSWDPGSSLFAFRMLATMLVTVIAAQHAHIHAAALLIVPGLLVATSARAPSLLKAAMEMGIVVPSAALAIALTLGLYFPAAIAISALLGFGFLLLIMVLLILVELRQGAAERGGAYPQQPIYHGDAVTQLD